MCGPGTVMAAIPCHSSHDALPLCMSQIIPVYGGIGKVGAAPSHGGRPGGETRGVCVCVGLAPVKRNMCAVTRRSCPWGGAV